jgi:hypothetical protein
MLNILSERVAGQEDRVVDQAWVCCRVTSGHSVTVSLKVDEPLLVDEIPFIAHFERPAAQVIDFA